MYIKTDSEGYVIEYATIGGLDDTSAEVELTGKEVAEFELNFRSYKYENEKLVFVKEKQELVERSDKIEQLRIHREQECFKKVNRGTLWLNTLTAKQISELDNWYHAWLDVTDTLITPEKPLWLN